MADRSCQDEFTGEEADFFKERSGFLKALYIYTRNQLKDIQDAEARVVELEKEVTKIKKGIEHHNKSVVDAKEALKLHGIDWDTISTLFKL